MMEVRTIKERVYSRYLQKKGAAKQISAWSQFLSQMTASPDKPEALQDMVVLDLSYANFSGTVAASFFRRGRSRGDQDRTAGRRPGQSHDPLRGQCKGRGYSIPDGGPEQTASRFGTERAGGPGKPQTFGGAGGYPD